MTSPDASALVVVDVQRAFADPRWGPRDNPEFEANVGRLLARWRARGRPVVLVRHDSAEPDSPLRAGSAGNAFQDVVGDGCDLLVAKRVHSAFHGDVDLAGWLRERRLGAIVVAGIATDHCCETTARVGADLGFDVTFVLDATHTFDRTTPDGIVLPAADVARATAASLHGEFAEVTSTATVLERG